MLLPHPPFEFKTITWRIIPLGFVGLAQVTLAARRKRSNATIGHRGMLASMRIEFLKMQGLGNDFVVFDAPTAGARVSTRTPCAPSLTGAPESASTRR